MMTLSSNKSGESRTKSRAADLNSCHQPIIDFLYFASNLIALPLTMPSSIIMRPERKVSYERSASEIEYSNDVTEPSDWASLTAGCLPSHSPITALSRRLAPTRRFENGVSGTCTSRIVFNIVGYYWGANMHITFLFYLEAICMPAHEWISAV